MSLQIDPDRAEKRIDEFLQQIDELLDKRYDEGKAEKRSMSTKLDNFAEVAFSDGKKKKNSLYSSVGIVTSGGRSPQRKQEDYEESLRRKKRNLEAWKEQIELEKAEESDNTDNSAKNYKDIETEISEISEELPIYADDLKKSIEELREEHYLASAMIAGRIIDYTIDQVKSSQNLGGPEQVLEQLESDEVVDPRESKITNSIKSYRDVYAHEIGKSPDIAETLIILSGCVKLLHNIQNAGKARDYDLI